MKQVKVEGVTLKRGHVLWTLEGLRIRINNIYQSAGYDTTVAYSVLKEDDSVFASTESWLKTLSLSWMVPA